MFWNWLQGLKHRLTRGTRGDSRRRASRRNRTHCIPPGCIENLEDRMLLSSGGLDPTFGTGGTTLTTFSLGNDTAEASAVQPNGQIVVVGITPGGTGNVATSADFALARYNANGTLDASFGTNGKVATSFGTMSDAYSVALQSDGKIVVVGTVSNGGFSYFTVARYTTNGSLDTTFGTGGVVFSQLGVGNSQATSVFLQADGKIVVGGTDFNGEFDAFALARYNTNGTLDTTFGSGGSVTTLLGAANSFGTRIKVQPNQNILLGGEMQSGSFQYFVVVRYQADGSVDGSFGNGGIVVTSVGTTDTLSGMVVQPNGDIAIAGTAVVGRVNNFAVVRYLSNGALDGSFGGNGFVTTSFGGNAAEANSIQVQTNNKIVVGGSVSAGTTSNFALARYNLDGSLDTTFGARGQMTTALGTGNSQILDIRLQPDGNIVAVGAADNGFNGVDFALARYIGPVTFPGGDPNTVEVFMRAYNPNAEFHFFTTSVNEFNAVINLGYTNETKGVAGFAVRAGQASGTVPIYRLYNPTDGQHYYTTSLNERTTLEGLGWNYEANEGYIYTTQTPDTTKIYTLYNNISGEHLYTQSQATMETIIAQFPTVWSQAGTLGYGYPVSPTGDITAPSTAPTITATELAAQSAPEVLAPETAAAPVATPAPSNAVNVANSVTSGGSNASTAAPPEPATSSGSTPTATGDSSATPADNTATDAVFSNLSWLENA